MIIVSQEKIRIFNFNNLTQLYVYIAEEEKEYEIRCETVDSLYEILGIYKTEERAKEVLEEIGGAYVVTQMLLCPTMTTATVLKGEDIAELMCYKMPAE